MTEAFHGTGGHQARFLPRSMPAEPAAMSHSSSEHVSPDGVVESVQRLTLESPVVSFDEDGARELGRRYWSQVRRATRGLVATRERRDGIDLVLAGFVPLLRFGPAETRVSDHHVACSYAITGGLLALGAGGSLSVEQLADPSPSLAISVSGYQARFARRGRHLYTRVQAPAHLAVSRRFLQQPARGIPG